MKNTTSKIITFVLALSVLLMVLAGCSNTGNTSAPSEEENTGNNISADATGSESVSYKPDLRIGINADITTFNQYAGNASVTYQTTNSTLEGLVKMDEEGIFQPKLATSWENNADFTEWTFHLRQDVKFHDGSEFTAEDVKFIWEYASLSENVSMPIVGRQILKEVTVEDEYTVTFKLHHSSTEWLYYAEQPILCENAIETLGFDEGGKIGTGPFYLDNIETGVSWTLRRNENYWGDTPKSESITFIVLPDVSSRALALRSRDIDAMFDGSYSDIVGLRADDEFNVYETENANVLYCGFNATSEMGSNPIVRQAFAMAINRDDIVFACYEGGICGSPAYNFVGEAAVGHVDVDYYEYDPEGAKALLEEHGLAGITLQCYTFAKYIPECEIVQANLASIGVNVNITEWTQTGFTSSIRDDNNFDFAVNVNFRPGGAISVIDDFFRTGTTRSWVQYANPEFDAMLDEALASSSFEELLAKYAELQQIVADEAYVVPMTTTKLYCVGTSNFYGVEMGHQQTEINYSGCYVIE